MFLKRKKYKGYCSRCGSKMVETSKPVSYDVITGLPTAWWHTIDCSREKIDGRVHFKDSLTVISKHPLPPPVSIYVLYGGDKMVAKEVELDENKSWRLVKRGIYG